MYARAFYEAGDFDPASLSYSAMLAADSTNVEAMGRLGAMAARAGDPVMARQMDERLKRVQKPYLMGANHRWRAVIAAAQGKTDEAVALLDMAVRQGHRLMDSPPNFTVHLDPDLMGLEKTAAWKGLLQGLADASVVK
jgi:hypothetical protein